MAWVQNLKGVTDYNNWYKYCFGSKAMVLAWLMGGGDVAKTRVQKKKKNTELYKYYDIGR